MLHAVIRGERDALHFMADVDPYNLQTLQQHVAGARMDSRGRVRLQIEVDPQDVESFDRYAGRWLRRLVRQGAYVEVNARRLGPPTQPAALRA